MIVVTKYSEPSGPFFYYDPPTNESYGAGPPNVRDPYERKWLDLVRLYCSGSQPTSNIKILSYFYVTLDVDEDLRHIYIDLI